MNCTYWITIFSLSNVQAYWMERIVAKRDRTHDCSARCDMWIIIMHFPYNTEPFTTIEPSSSSSSSSSLLTVIILDKFRREQTRDETIFIFIFWFRHLEFFHFQFPNNHMTHIYACTNTHTCAIIHANKMRRQKRWRPRRQRWWWWWWWCIWLNGLICVRTIAMAHLRTYTYSDRRSANINITFLYLPIIIIIIGFSRVNCSTRYLCRSNCAIRLYLLMHACRICVSVQSVCAYRCLCVHLVHFNVGLVTCTRTVETAWMRERERQTDRWHTKDCHKTERESAKERFQETKILIARCQLLPN